MARVATKISLPTELFGRSAIVSAGPVAVGGWLEAVENILRRGFANVLRLGVATAALRTRNFYSEAMLLI